MGQASRTATTTTTTRILIHTACLLLALASLAEGQVSQQRSMFAARRAADDARPLSRVGHLSAAASQATPAVVMGQFRAPAPERSARQRIPKSSDFGSQTLAASFQVSDNHSDLPEKVVHGVTGPSSQLGREGSKERRVGARIQVSDEGLNYPPSKLSADIYGNVAEIVTAPPEAVDNDILVPQANKLYGARRAN